MSVTAGYVCLTCRQYAPNVGDFGLLGAPEIKPRTDCRNVFGSVTEVASFGYWYEALAGLGLRRADLEDLAEWLQAHAGHDLEVDAGGENEAVRAIGEDKAVLEASHRLSLQIDERREARQASGDLTEGCYTARCLHCSESLVCEERESFVTFGPFQPSEGARSLFVSRFDEPTPCLAHRVYGAVDPFEFVPTLVAFLRKHAGHPIEVSLE